MKGKKLLFFIIILLTLPLYPQVNIYGTYYNNLAVIEKDGNWLYTDLNLFYLKLLKPSHDDFKLKTNLSFSLFVQPYRQNREEFDIQRLNFQTEIEDIYLTLGRFLPQYHYTNFFQPLNVFLGPQFFREDVIYKGIDGILLRKFLGQMTSVEYVAVPSGELYASSHLLNLTSHLGSFDFSFIGLYEGVNKTYVPGIGFKGDIGVSIFNETLVEIRDDSENLDLTTATGMDYSFGNFMVMVEYLYDGGTRYQLPREGLSLQDKHYLFLNAFHFKTMGRTMGLSGIFNLNDKSSILSTYYEKEILHGLNFMAGIYIPVSGDEEDEFSSRNLGSLILNCYLRARF